MLEKYDLCAAVTIYAISGNLCAIIMMCKLKKSIIDYIEYAIKRIRKNI